MVEKYIELENEKKIFLRGNELSDCFLQDYTIDWNVSIVYYLHFSILYFFQNYLFSMAY